MKELYLFCTCILIGKFRKNSPSLNGYKESGTNDGDTHANRGCLCYHCCSYSQTTHCSYVRTRVARVNEVRVGPDQSLFSYTNFKTQCLKSGTNDETSTRTEAAVCVTIVVAIAKQRIVATQERRAKFRENEVRVGRTFPVLVSKVASPGIDVSLVYKL